MNNSKINLEETVVIINNESFIRHKINYNVLNWENIENINGINYALIPEKLRDYKVVEIPDGEHFSRLFVLIRRRYGFKKERLDKFLGENINVPENSFQISTTTSITTSNPIKSLQEIEFNYHENKKILHEAINKISKEQFNDKLQKVNDKSAKAIINVINLVHHIVNKDAKIIIHNINELPKDFSNQKALYFHGIKDQSKKAIIFTSESENQIKVYTNKDKLDLKNILDDLEIDIIAKNGPYNRIFKRDINNFNNIKSNNNSSEIPLVDFESIIKDFNSAKTNDEKTEIFREFLEIDDDLLNLEENINFNDTNSTQIFNNKTFNNNINLITNPQNPQNLITGKNNNQNNLLRDASLSAAAGFFTGLVIASVIGSGYFIYKKCFKESPSKRKPRNDINNVQYQELGDLNKNP